MLCTRKTETVSTNVDLHALLDSAQHIKYCVVALQETNTEKRTCDFNDRIFIFRGDIPSKLLSEIQPLDWLSYVYALPVRRSSASATTFQDQQLTNHGLSTNVAIQNVDLERERQPYLVGQNFNLMKKEHQRWTWELPNGTRHSEIDYISANENETCDVSTSIILQRSRYRHFQAKIGFS